MAQRFLFLLFHLTYFTGAWGQFTMTQPPSLSVSPGGTVRLTCTRAGGSISKYYVSWYQQKPGTKAVLQIYQYSRRPSGIPERFSGSYDSSSNSATLSISNVEPEDEADYYCLSYDNNEELVFGGGTHLTIIGQPTVSPSVQVFAPSQEEIRSPNPYTVVCLITDFYPPGFLVQWKGGEGVITSGVETTKASKQGDKYLASSYLKLTAAEFNKYENFTCEVTHENKKISKTVSKSGSC